MQLLSITKNVAIKEYRKIHMRLAHCLSHRNEPLWKWKMYARYDFVIFCYEKTRNDIIAVEIPIAYNDDY